MKACSPVVLVVAFAPIAFGGGDCAGPGSLCAALAPGMVAFIGQPVSVTHAPNKPPAVTFRVRERLVGLAGAESATVVFGDGYSDSNELRLLILTPTSDGRYLHDDCGSGYQFSLRDRLAREFRKNVATRAPAKLTVVVQSWPNVVPIPGVDVEVRGLGRVYRGTSRGNAALELGTVPPGEYEVAAKRPNFSFPKSPRRLTILPGSCAPLRIPLESVSTISGRAVYADGEPVAHSRFFLDGRARSLPSGFVYDWVVDRVQGVLFHDAGHLVMEHAETDSNGSFQFTRVYPGWYRLVADASKVNRREGIPFPKTFYPGVDDWPEATVLSIEEGQSIQNLLFRLPDFGTKRRVEIQVMDEDGAPVPGAVIGDTGFDSARIGTQRTSGKDGRVALDLWRNAEYCLVATVWVGKNRWYSSDVFWIPMHTAPVNPAVVLKGYHSHKPAR